MKQHVLSCFVVLSYVFETLFIHSGTAFSETFCFAAEFQKITAGAVLAPESIMRRTTSQEIADFFAEFSESRQPAVIDFSEIDPDEPGAIKRKSLERFRASVRKSNNDLAVAYVDTLSATIPITSNLTVTQDEYRNIFAHYIGQLDMPLILLVEAEHTDKAPEIMRTVSAWLREIKRNEPVILVPFAKKAERLFVKKSGRLPFLGEWFKLNQVMVTIDPGKLRISGCEGTAVEKKMDGFSRVSRPTSALAAAYPGMNEAQLSELCRDPAALVPLSRRKTLPHAVALEIIASRDEEASAALLNNPDLALTEDIARAVVSSFRFHELFSLVVRMSDTDRIAHVAYQAFVITGERTILSQTVFELMKPDSWKSAVIIGLTRTPLADWSFLYREAGGIDRMMTLLIDAGNKDPAALCHIIRMVFAAEPPTVGASMIEGLFPAMEDTPEARHAFLNLARQLLTDGVFDARIIDMLASHSLTLMHKAFILNRIMWVARTDPERLPAFTDALRKTVFDSTFFTWVARNKGRQPAVVDLWMRVVLTHPEYDTLRETQLLDRILDSDNRGMVAAFASAVQALSAPDMLPASFSVKPDNMQTLFKILCDVIVSRLANKQKIFELAPAAVRQLPKGSSLRDMVRAYGNIPPEAIIPVLNIAAGSKAALRAADRLFGLPEIKRRIVLQHLICDELVLVRKEDDRLRNALKGFFALCEREIVVKPVPKSEQKAFIDALQLLMVIGEYYAGLSEDEPKDVFEDFFKHISAYDGISPLYDAEKRMLAEIIDKDFQQEGVHIELFLPEIYQRIERVINYWHYKRRWAAEGVSSEERAALHTSLRLLRKAVVSYVLQGGDMKDIKYGGTPESAVQLMVMRKMLQERITADLAAAGITGDTARALAGEYAETCLDNWTRDVNDVIDMTWVDRRYGKVHVFTSDTMPMWLTVGTTGGGFCLAPSNIVLYTKTFSGSAFSALKKSKHLGLSPAGDRSNTVFESLVPVEGETGLWLLNERLYSSTGLFSKTDVMRKASVLSAIRNAARCGATGAMLPFGGKSTQGETVAALDEQLRSFEMLVEHRDSEGNVLMEERVTVGDILSKGASLILPREANRWEYWDNAAAQYVDGKKLEMFKENHQIADYGRSDDYVLAGVPFKGLKVRYNQAVFIVLKREFRVAAGALTPPPASRLRKSLETGAEHAAFDAAA